MADHEDPVTPPQLQPCSICSRTFLPESLGKHYKTCEKNASKKRKIFDSTKQRVQGTDLAAFLPVILKTKKVEKEKTPARKEGTQKWKEQHLEFVRAIRAARGVNDGDQGASMGAITRPANHEQCPTCERNFGPKAYDRHIEWCREKHARLPNKSNTSTEAVMAKERLEARTKYRAPPLNKSKREITREKYSASSSRTGAGDSKRASGEKANNVPTASHTHSQASPVVPSPKESSSAPHFQRTPHRSSYRQGSASPVKRNPVHVVPSTMSERREAAQLRTRGVSPQKGRRDAVKESPQKAAKKVREPPPPTQKVGRSSNDVEAMSNKQRPAPTKKNDNIRNRNVGESVDPLSTNSVVEDSQTLAATETKCRSGTQIIQRKLPSVQAMKTLPLKEPRVKLAFTPSKITYDNSIYKQAVCDKPPVIYRRPARLKRNPEEVKFLALSKRDVTMAARRSKTPMEQVPMNRVNVSEDNFENNSRPFNEKLRGARKVKAVNVESETYSSSKDNTPRHGTSMQMKEMSIEADSASIRTQTDVASVGQSDNSCLDGLTNREEQTYSGRSDDVSSIVNTIIRRTYPVDKQHPDSGRSYSPNIERNGVGTYSVRSSVDMEVGQTNSSYSSASVFDRATDRSCSAHSSINVDRQQTYSGHSGRCSDDVKTKHTFPVHSGRQTDRVKMGQTYSGHSNGLEEELNMGRTYSVCSDRSSYDTNMQQTYSLDNVSENIDMSRTYTLSKATVSERCGNSNNSGNTRGELSLADLAVNSVTGDRKRNMSGVQQSQLACNVDISVAEIELTSPVSFRDSNMTSTPICSEKSWDLQGNVSYVGDVQCDEVKRIDEQLSRQTSSLHSTTDRQIQRTAPKSTRKIATKYTVANRNNVSAVSDERTVDSENTSGDCCADVEAALQDKSAGRLSSRSSTNTCCRDNLEEGNECNLRGTHLSVDRKESIVDYLEARVSAVSLHSQSTSSGNVSQVPELNLDRISSTESERELQQDRSASTTPLDSVRSHEEHKSSSERSYLESERDYINDAVDASKNFSFDDVSIFNDDFAEVNAEVRSNVSPRSFLSECESYYKAKESLVEPIGQLSSNLSILEMSTSSSDEDPSYAAMGESKQVCQPVLRYWGSDFRLSFEENKSYSLGKLKYIKHCNKKPKSCNSEVRYISDVLEENDSFSCTKESPLQDLEKSCEQLVTVWSNENLARMSNQTDARSQATNCQINANNINVSFKGELECKGASRRLRSSRGGQKVTSLLREEVMKDDYDHSSRLDADLKTDSNHNVMSDLEEPMKRINNKTDVSEYKANLQGDVAQVKIDLVQNRSKVKCSGDSRRKVQELVCLKTDGKAVQKTTERESVKVEKVRENASQKLNSGKSETLFSKEHAHGIQRGDTTTLSKVLCDTSPYLKNLNHSEVEYSFYGDATETGIEQFKESAREVRNRNAGLPLRYPKKSKRQTSETTGNCSIAIEHVEIIKLNVSSDGDLTLKHSKKSKQKETEPSFWTRQAEVIKSNESNLKHNDELKLKQSKKSKHKEPQTNFWAEQAEIINVKESASRCHDDFNPKLSRKARTTEPETSFWEAQADIIKLKEPLIKTDELKINHDDIKIRVSKHNCNFWEEQAQAIQRREDERERSPEEYRNPNRMQTVLASPLPRSHQSLGGSQSFPQETSRTLYADDESEDEDRVAVVALRTDSVRRFKNKARGDDEEFATTENPGNNRRAMNRNTDSAYSSLNRKSPLLSMHTILNQSDSVNVAAERMQLSSSGSDSELPRMNTLKMSVARLNMHSPVGTEVSTPTPTNQLGSNQQEHSAQKMSKFCHECGYKFPMQMAKFCCECGVKRLVV